MSQGREEFLVLVKSSNGKVGTARYEHSDARTLIIKLSL